jgi:hypothetical protein
MPTLAHLRTSQDLAGQCRARGYFRSGIPHLDVAHFPRRSTEMVHFDWAMPSCLSKMISIDARRTRGCGR